MDDFLGNDVAADMIHVPKPPFELASSFRQHAERALVLAEQQVAAHPKDADAHYQVGTTIGLLASYAATVDGQVFGAMKYARRAYKESSTALTLDPRRKDAGLIVGVYQYLVSTRSLPVRWLAYVAGLASDRARGIKIIEAAAQYPGENQTDARMMLVLVYNRERRFDDALTVLTDLRTRYPRNRLLWLESGATALRAGRLDEAEQFLDTGLSQLAVDSRPRAFGEEALWHYKRGAVRARLNRVVDATTDLDAALTGETRDWVRGRARLELGRLAEAAGDRGTAVSEYRTAARLAKAADDDIGLAEAERLLNGPSH
jgi:tetratricopeptide (TPR) repeat protein